jgi:hypothetical protein
MVLIAKAIMESASKTVAARGQFTYSVVRENAIMDMGIVTESEPFAPSRRGWANSELIARCGDAIVRAQWRTTNQSKL